MVPGYVITDKMNTIKGDTLHIRANDVTTDYYKGKCCRHLVWKGPRYEDSPW
jgi:hypothetical protein